MASTSSLRMASRIASRAVVSTGAGVRAMSTAAAVASRASFRGVTSASSSAMPIVFAAGALAAAGATGVALSEPVDYKAVKEAIAELLDDDEYDDGSYGPVFVRLAWHLSGSYDKASNTGGSNGATMRFKPESDYGANAGLKIARDRLEVIKKKFPSVSYADIYTLAGVVAIEEMGGPDIDWKGGRTDCKETDPIPPDGRLPDAAQGAAHIRDIFYRMGFDDQEIVALAGAHALGRCHPDRSGFDKPWTRAPTTFSNEYFRLLLEEKWHVAKVPSTGNSQFQSPQNDIMMLPADMALLEDPEFAKWVKIYSADEDRFFADFAKAFSKLLHLGFNPGSGGIFSFITNLFK